MNEELIQYYIDLLILQYRGKDRAPEHIRALIETIMIFDLIESVKNGYDVDTAIGMQQDVIGKYIGIDRVVTGTSFTRDYWGFSKYGDVSPFTFFPFIEYSASVPDVQFRRYEESNQSLFTLTDEEFRTIQRLKIIQNNSNYSASDIDNFIQDFFGNQALFNDRLDMTISYIFDESVERLVTIAVSENLIPKPAAVGLSVSFTVDINNIFTFVPYGETPPSYAVGYSQYGITPIGGMAKYG